MQEEEEVVTPGEILGNSKELKPGKGAYVAPHNNTVYASLTGFRRIVSPPPDSPDQRPIVEVFGHKTQGVVPETGAVVLARITKVTARTASVAIMCVGPKSVRDKFTGIIRQQDVRATEIDKVDMHLSFRPGDIVRAVVALAAGAGSSSLSGLASGTVCINCVEMITECPELSLGDARAYYLSTAKNELGVVSADSEAGATMVPISWTEMQCPETGQIEQRKVAEVRK